MLLSVLDACAEDWLDMPDEMIVKILGHEEVKASASRMRSLFDKVARDEMQEI